MKHASLRSPSLGLLLASLLVACGGGGGSGDTTSSGTVISAAPSAVSDVVATPGDQSIVLGFKVSNPQNVTGFEAVCTGDGKTVTVRSDSHGTATDEVLVTGLSNAQDYSCTVSALNTSGTSTAAAAATVIVGATSTAGTPASPGSVVVTGTATSAVISFTESGLDGGTAVSSYVGICVGPDKVSYSYAAASPITVLGLTPDVPYTCWASALNAVGAGKASAASVVTPLAGAAVAAGAPAAPTGIQVTRGAGAAIVAFDTGGASASASKRRAKGTATASGDLYRATCYIDSQVVTVESSASPITVPQLVNGRDYHCVVTRVTPAGTSADSAVATVTPATAADAPTLTDAVGGDTTATVSFTAPAQDGGSAITGYRVACTAGAKLAQRDAGPAARSVQVAGLVNGTAYDCSVAAINDVGVGAFSATKTVTALAATAPTGDAAPSAPQAVQATIGNGSVTISFTPVTDSSSPVIDYTATCTSTSEQLSQTGTGSSITVSGLADGTPYECVVTARTEAGTVSSASAAQTVTLALTAPPAPVLLSVTPGPASIAVAFEPGSGAGSPATTYAATCGDVTGPAAATSPLAVSGLTNGNIYACWVEATNAAGSTRSVESKSTKPRTTPQAPTQLRAEAGNASITLSYQAPADDGGADINGYTANCRSGTQLWAVNAPSKDSYSIVVPGLTNGNAYECTVFASNVAGSGVPSASVPATPSATVVETAPAMATDLAIASVGNGELTVSFTRPATNGDDVSYALVCSPGDINKSAGTASSVKVTVLVNGTSYTCLIRAKRGSLSTDSETVSATPNTVPIAPTLSRTIGDRTLGYSFAPVPGEAYIPSCSGGTVSDITNGSFSLTELTNGQSYSCSVTATNSAGSAMSATVSGTPNAPPAAPTLSRTIGDKSLSYGFTPVAGETYTASCSVGTVSAITNGSFSVTGLTNGTSYGCWVTATNSAGSATSATLSGTPNALPAVPVLSVTVGNQKLGFSFTAVAGETYAANCPAGMVSAIGNGSFMLTGLNNGTSYGCGVTATNSAGSTASVVVAATPNAAPDKPVLSVTVADSQLNYSFTRVANVVYTASCISGEIAGSTFSRAGLPNGTPFSCTLTATNSAGSRDSDAVAATPYGAPGKPSVTSLTFSCVNNKHYMTAEFAAPTSTGGGTDLKYTGTLVGKHTVDGSVQSKTLPATTAGSMRFTIDGMGGTFNFSFTVSATNSGGLSTTSDTSATVQGGTYIDCPESV